MVKDYYATLGIPSSASKEEITKAYRALAKQCHPDTHPANPKEAEARFKEISEAYAVLSDPKKRAMYEEVDPPGWEEYAHKQQWANEWETYRAWAYTKPDMADAFTYAHGVDMHHWHSDVIYPLTLSFEEMVRGGEKEFTIRRRISCTPCQGLGGFDMKTCPFCEGTGFIGAMRTPNAKCGVCQGVGKRPNKACEECHSTRRINKDQTIRLKIKPGAMDNYRCILPGLGNEDDLGVLGSLIVVLTVLPHPKFQRAGLDITSHCAVDVFSVLVGGETTVETMHGWKKITLKPYAGPDTTMSVRIPGAGINRGDRKGDHVVTLRCTIPTQLDDEQLDLVRKIINKGIKV